MIVDTIRQKCEKGIILDLRKDFDKRLMSPEDAFGLFYDSATFSKTFSFWPFASFKTDTDTVEVGSIVTLSFTFPPFRYQVVITDVKTNSLIRGTLTSGVSGELVIRVKEQDGIVTLTKVIHVKCPSAAKHLNAFLSCYYQHVPFMNARINKYMKQRNLRRQVNEG